MSIFNDDVMEAFASGMLNAVCEYVSNVIGCEMLFNPKVTLEEAVRRGFEESSVDDTYERYGIETIFRLLERSDYKSYEELDVLRKKYTDKVMKLCVNFYKKALTETYEKNPGMSTEELSDILSDDLTLSGSVYNENYMIRKIMKLLREYEERANAVEW
jgi:hypothetical protein